MKQLKNILLIVFVLVLQIGQAQEWSIALSPVDVDCVTNTACYNVLMKSTAEDFEIGSSNLRVFYNAGTQKFLKDGGAISVNKGYRISNDKLKSQEASLEGKGSLSFEKELGLLDIPIDFLEEGNEAMTISSKAYTVLASNICFQSTGKESVASPSDFVWVSDKTKEQYTTAYTTVNTVSGTSTNLKSSKFETQAAETRSDCGATALLSRASNYPNPFIESTKISYSIQHDTYVNLNIYAMDGRLVYNEEVNKIAGNHQFNITQDQLDGAGVYIYKIQTSNNSIEARMLLLK